MATPAVTLKLRRFRRRFGIAAPRVSVRSHIDWRWYVMVLGAFVVAVAAAAWLVVPRDGAAGMERELAELRERIAGLDEELVRLRGKAGTEQSTVQMEKGALRQMSLRVKALELENGALKEDIAFFDKLVPADGAESSVRIERIRLTPEVEPGRFRFRLLVAFQPSKQIKEFKGRLQLNIGVEREGGATMLVYPGAKDSQGEYLVEVRHFARKEGVIVLPAGVRVKSVEALLIQGGGVKSKALAEF